MKSAVARRPKARRIATTDASSSSDNESEPKRPPVAGAARRSKPRKISLPAPSASDDGVKTPETTATEGEAGAPSAPDAPLPFPRPAKSKKPASKLRLSFGVEETADAEPDSAFVPKKSALSRKALERHAARRSGLGAGVVGMENLTLTPGQDRVSYSREYLDELKSAQATTPVPLVGEDEDMPMVLSGGDDVDAPQTPDRGPSTSTVARPVEQMDIPDEGLVRVMKQRRKERADAARAGAEDFISLNRSDDDDDNELILRPKKKKESRLARPDDFMDDDEIENYVNDDERLLVGNNKALRREQERRRRQGIRDAINEAEGIDDDSEASRDSLIEDWERDQIRKGAFSSADTGPVGFEGDLEVMARNPPTVTPLPDLKDVLARLEGSLKSLELRKAQTERQVENLAAEKGEIREREGRVQEQLTKAAAEYEKLRKDTGLGGGGGGEGVVDRGLESFGSTPVRVNDEL